MSSYLSDLLRCIQRKDPAEKLERFFSIIPKDEILKWKDKEKLDLLHHCILTNHPEAVQMFLKNGVFIEPYQPEVKPYLHLAAKLGHRTLINLLLTHRLGDNRALRIEDCGVEFTFKHSHKKCTPLDIAALEKHLPCVLMILTQHTIKQFPDHAKNGFLALATLAGSSAAVKLVLKEEKVQKKDVLDAVEVAIKTANAECLALLLDTGTSTSTLFEGKNLFHVLYTFGSSGKFGKEGYARLPEVTEVLVARKHNVNKREPTNTYPIYSLIRNSICVHNYVWSQYYLECLKILLKGGADPNFDETALERALLKKGKKSIAGRPAFSSAIHCLLETVETYAEVFDSKALAAKFLMECVEAICHYLKNSKLDHVRQIGKKGGSLTGSVLHQFAKSSVKLGVDSTIFKYLLRQGADINCRSKGKYFLNVFIDELFRTLNEKSPHVAHADRSSDVREMLNLCSRMSHNALVQTFEIFQKEHGNNLTVQTTKYIQQINQQLGRSVKHIPSLKKLVSDHLWIICRRDAHVVHKLPISAKCKTDILPV